MMPIFRDKNVEYMAVTRVSHSCFVLKLCPIIEPVHDISNNVVCEISKGSDQAAHTGSLTRAFACRLNIT